MGQVLRYWGDNVGTRAQNNGKMRSLGMAGFKNPALAPLFITMVGGMVFVAAYCIRSLTANIDVTWRKGVESPQSKHIGEQYKFMNPRGTDFSQFKPPTY